MFQRIFIGGTKYNITKTWKNITINKTNNYTTARVIVNNNTIAELSPDTDHHIELLVMKQSAMQVLLQLALGPL